MLKLFALLPLLFFAMQASAQQANEELIVENFDYNPKGWLLENSDEAEAFIEYGVYNLNNKRPQQSKIYFKEIAINSDANYSIELRFLQKSGLTNVAHGLVWNYSSAEDYLCFKINLDGMYRIDGKKEGKEIILQDWKKMKKKDWRRIGQNQVLSLVKTDKNTTYFINETKMYVSENTPLTGQGIGILMDSQMEIKVDYVRIIRSDNLD